MEHFHFMEFMQIIPLAFIALEQMIDFTTKMLKLTDQITMLTRTYL